MLLIISFLLSALTFSAPNFSIPGKRELKEKCLKNSDFSCFKLGKWELDLGNRSLAKVYLAQACSTGVLDSCLLLAEAEEVDQRPHKAKKWYWMSCEKGVGRACLKMGLYFKESNLSMALKWFDRGCERSNFDACFQKALIYQKQNKLALFQHLLEQNCSHLHGDSCLKIGELEFKEGKLSSALNYFKKGCASNNKKACTRFKETKTFY